MDTKSIDLRDILDLLKSVAPGLVIVGIAMLGTFVRRPYGRGFEFRISILEAMALFAFVVLSAAIVYPVVRSSRESDGPRPCLSNVKQLGLGILMYLQDFDERFPPAAQWGDADYPYLKNRDSFKCPNSTSPFGYAFNKHLNLLPQKKVRDEKATVMLFEANATSINGFGGKGLLVREPRHNGMNVFGFVDGHAQRRAKDSVLRWEP